MIILCMYMHCAVQCNGFAVHVQKYMHTCREGTTKLTYAHAAVLVIPRILQPLYLHNIIVGNLEWVLKVRIVSILPGT